MSQRVGLEALSRFSEDFLERPFPGRSGQAAI